MIHSCKRFTESSFAAMSDKGQAYHLTWCGATSQVTQQAQEHETADCPIVHPGKKHTQWKISKKSSKKAKTSKKSSKKASSSKLLDKNGKPLKGAALAKRQEKLANAPASDSTPAYVRENADLGLRGEKSTSSHPGHATARAAAKPSGLSEDSVKNLIDIKLAEYSAHAQRESAERHDKLEDKLEAILARLS